MYLFISLLAYAVAEPPVGDGYPSARARHDHNHHGDDIQRSLSQDYGVPSINSRSQGFTPNDARLQIPTAFIPSSRSAPSQEYGPPGFRSGLSQEYGIPNVRSGLSQEYGVPNSRTLSQQYGPPNSRSSLSADYNTPSGRSQDNNIVNSRLSQEYGIPQLRTSSDHEYKNNIPSDSYGTPLQRSSTLQGQEFRSTPSQEYGIPSLRNYDQSPSQKYGQPNFRNSQSYNPNARESASGRFNNKASSVSTRNFQSSFGSRSSPSQGFAASRSLSSQYEVPSARNFDSYSPDSKSISPSYLPSSRSVSPTYGTPDGRSLSSEYDRPEARNDFNTNAFTSSFETARSSPASKYGVPSAREMPSNQYGVPEQYTALSSQGYSYARNALDELLNQEPANYDFGYKVSDYITGSDFGHTETRQENKAEGSYFVVLPDGTKQVVEYEADERGFKPRISVEPAEGRGYDDNAADLSRSAEGPY